MSENGKKCVLFFVKYPVAGKVKTRLAGRLGNNAAADLYKCFVTDLLTMLRGLDLHFIVVYDPSSSRNQFQRWLGKKHHFMRQAGCDLGLRMKNAFLQAFKGGFENVVLIGSDIPDLPQERIKSAFAVMNSCDAAIGPANDGGYYLIGFTKRSYLPEPFESIAWGTPRVCRQTLYELKKHKRKVFLLKPWYDIDTFEDIKSLLSRNENTAFRQSRTYSYLMKNNFE